MEGMSPGLTDLDLLAALVGIGMPPLVAVVVSSRWQPWQRGAAAAAMCIAAGLATTWIAGDLAGVTPVRAVLVVAMATFGSYRRFWHTTGITKKIEDATSAKPGRKRKPKPSRKIPTWRNRGPVKPPRGEGQPLVIAPLPQRSNTPPQPPRRSPPAGGEWYE